MAGHVAPIERTASALDSLLLQIVRGVEPTAAQKEGARASHHRLRELLDTGQMASRIIGSYLSGSYARDTAIKPIDDVDIIFEIDPGRWPRSSLLSTLPSPDQVLESFATAIRRRYRVSSVYGQRRSVRLQLHHIDIDIVPVAPHETDPLMIYVPDREAGEWIKSSPRRHADMATRVNTKRNGKFKPLIKLVKLWNSKLPDTVRCKSFLIETIAIRLFDQKSFGTLGEGLVLFWDFLASRYNEPTVNPAWGDYGMSFSWLSVSVPDTAGTGANVAARLDRSRARALASKARISRDKILAAYEARAAATQRRMALSALRAR